MTNKFNTDFTLTTMCYYCFDKLASQLVSQDLINRMLDYYVWYFACCETTDLLYSVVRKESSDSL